MTSAKRRAHAAVLHITMAIAVVPAVLATGSQACGLPASQAADGSVPPSADKHGPIANGIYAVLREGLTREELKEEKAPHFVLVYDRKYIASDEKEAPKYVALNSSSFVPLDLAGPPEKGPDYRGHPTLNLALAPENVKRLENFTREHLGDTVATVIDSEIITMHKVRSVIADGRAQISRCTDNACEILRIKLSK